MMIHQPTLLPTNWLELVSNFDTSKSKSSTRVLHPVVQIEKNENLVALFKYKDDD